MKKALIAGCLILGVFLTGCSGKVNDPVKTLGSASEAKTEASTSVPEVQTENETVTK